MRRSVSQEELHDGLIWYSEAVSKGVRTMAFGVIAGVWAVLSADRLGLQPDGVWGISSSTLVTMTFLFASLTLLFDITQYVAAYWMYDIGSDKWDSLAESGAEFDFDYTSKSLGHFGMALYWVNYWCLRIKLLLAILSGFAFVGFAFAIHLT